MRPRAGRWCDCEGHRRWERAGSTLFCNGFGNWLLATALKTPISVYLTLVPCAISTNITSSCSLAFIVDDFPRLPILSKLIGSTMRSTSLLASEYDSCGHRRCWTAAASCPYYSCRRRAKPVGIVLPCLRCSCTRCCALCFVDEDGRALYFGC